MRQQQQQQQLLSGATAHLMQDGLIQAKLNPIKMSSKCKTQQTLDEPDSANLFKRFSRLFYKTQERKKGREREEREILIKTKYLKF